MAKFFFFFSGKVCETHRSWPFEHLARTSREILCVADRTRVLRRNQVNKCRLNVVNNKMRKTKLQFLGDWVWWRETEKQGLYPQTLLFPSPGAAEPDRQISGFPQSNRNAILERDYYSGPLSREDGSDGSGRASRVGAIGGTRWSAYVESVCGERDT
jgi:hypothetical protein